MGSEVEHGGGDHPDVSSRRYRFFANLSQVPAPVPGLIICHRALSLSMQVRVSCFRSDSPTDGFDDFSGQCFPDNTSNIVSLENFCAGMCA